MKKLLPLCALGFIALQTSGCSVNPATGKSSFTGLMSEQQELNVGRQEHPKILKQYGGSYSFKNLQTYVNDLGQRLAAVSELPNLKWTFTILDDPIINAFALPGGYIYISRGLITLAESEAELAAVLGHEVGHVTARHTAQRYSQSVVTGLGASILGAVVGGPAGNIASMAGQAYLAGYSRDHEMEADALGIRYMTKLGYDPKAAASFFEKLAQHTELEAKMKGKDTKQSHYSIFASHPDTQARVRATRTIAQQYPATLNQLNRPPFMAQISGIAFGESIKEGVIKGQEFIHPILRFTFTAPDGFTFTNRPDYVLASHQNGSAAIFQMGRDKYGLPPVRFLTEVWANKYQLVDVQSLTINNMPAATGIIQIKTKQGTRDLRYLAIKEGNEIFQFRFLTPPNVTAHMALPLRQMTYSFRRLSEREASLIKGQHIQLHRVGRGDTVASLSKRMKVEKYQQEWFQTLNQEALKDGLNVGETVKLIAH